MIDNFLRVFPVRAPSLMWLLGAGASASAGIPTAGSLIWEFKRTLFCAAQRISVKNCEDLSNASVQQRLNAYFQNLGTYPAEGAADEYATFFEAAYPDPKDRRVILDGYVTGAKPSYGHLVLAALMQMGKTRIVWTTNFDRLIEDAAVQALGSTSKLVVATTDNSRIAMEALNESRWPLLGKMHGDFQSRRLKNTSEELLIQDAEIRRALVESCRRFGLIVVGYSGRDESVMRALEDALDSGKGYPAGLYWFHRPDAPALPSVKQLIDKAVHCGIQAEILEAQTFDELLGDITKQLNDIPPDIQTRLDVRATRASEIPLEPPGQGWPVIRMNALPLTGWPTICRRIVCTIGGTREVRHAVSSQNVKAIATRAKVGVLGFGSDTDMKKAFGSFGITDFDCHSIEPKRLGYESTELGLLRDAFAAALKSAGPFRVERRRSSYFLIPDPDKISSDAFVKLKEGASSIAGRVPKTDVSWSEALRFRIDHQLGRLWLLVEPTIYLHEPIGDEFRDASDDFIRERLATRYNRQWNTLLDAWVSLIMANSDERKLSALGIADGIDASFTLSRITGFSRRSSAR
jgi:NAD-dependent SIR2 family protein deacetylase